MKSEIKDEVYRKYKSMVNMTYSELLRWSLTDCSKKASLTRKPIQRNLMLLSTPKNKWTSRQLTEANKVISYLARAKKIKSSKIVCSGYTKNEIALKNWAFDVRK